MNIEEDIELLAEIISSIDWSEEEEKHILDVFEKIDNLSII